MSSQKGQANIEYIVAMVIFVILVIYISFQIGGTIPYYHLNSMNNRLNSECLRITESMIKDSKMLHGFAEEPYKMNYTKILKFNDTCNGDPMNFENIYNKLKGNMSLSVERDFRLRIKIKGSEEFVCGRNYLPSGTTVASVNRYAVTDGKTTTISLMVW